MKSNFRNDNDQETGTTFHEGDSKIDTQSLSNLLHKVHHQKTKAKNVLIQPPLIQVRLTLPSLCQGLQPC